MKTRTIITIIAALLFTSCVNEELIEEGASPNDVSENMARIELFTNADDFSLPTTRIGQAEEDAIGSTPWVFVFKNLDTDKIFVEAVQAEVIDSKTYVRLQRSNDKRMLLIIANPPTSFYNSGVTAFNKTNLTAWLTGKTHDAARKMISTALASTSQNTVPYTSGSSPYPSLPMSGSCALNKITPSTTIGTSTNKVALDRIVAKVTVTNDADDFILEGATVAGASRQGYLFPVTPVETASDGVNLDVSTNYLFSTSGQEVTGIATVTGAVGAETTVSNPIYIYESEAGQTSVIIQGKYKSTTYYYKLAFQHATDTKPMAIVRNRWYQFKIISVDNIGYDSVAEAITAPPSNITAIMNVTELSSYDIIDNGQYYLGVSNSEFIALSDVEIPSTDNVVAVTVSTNATTGVASSVVSSTNDGSLLTVSPQSLTLSTGSTNIGETKLIIGLPATFTTSSEGTITIKLGNLTKEIRVKRKLALEYGPSMTEFSKANGFTDDFSAANGLSEDNFSAGIITSQGTGNEWLSLSLDGATPFSSEVAHQNAVGKLYLKAEKNNVIVGTARKGGEVYLSRHSESGRVKLYVSEIEIGENCYIVKKNGSVSIPIVRANASDLGLTRLGRTESVTPYLVWTDAPHNSSPVKGTGSNGAVNSFHIDGEGSHGHLVVNTGAREGNAVIAIKNAANKTLWSWHIWVTDSNPENDIYTSNGKTFMGRNLGALNNNKTTNNILALGLQYQWGRKDPFASSSSTTIGTDPLVYRENTSFYFNAIKQGVPTSGLEASSFYNLINAIQNPDIFYWIETPSGSNSSDWYSSILIDDAHNNKLWDDTSAKTVYDPCPKGWRVPTSAGLQYIETENPWYGLPAAPFTNGFGADWTYLDRGYYPAAGARSGTTLNPFIEGFPVGGAGYYWSAIPSNARDSYYLRFRFDATNHSTGTSGPRSYGCSVRCVKL